MERVEEKVNPHRSTDLSNDRYGYFCWVRVRIKVDLTYLGRLLMSSRIPNVSVSYLPRT